MDLGNALSGWFINQLEMMPAELLRQGAEWLAPGRLFDRMVGEREAAEIRALLSQPAAEGPRPSTVLLPGIMGSLLASVRGISAVLWFNPTVVLDGHINLLDLNDDGDGDRSPDVEITPVGIEKFTYLRLIVALAHETRLYEFPYDWRRHLEYNARLLHEALRRWSAGAPQRRYVLVGHSMGGMLARTYLALYPREAERMIERVVMLGTPLYGAIEAALIFTGETTQSQIVSRLNPANDVVRFASNLPASYQLLPPPPELFTPARPYPLNWDLYDARAWGAPSVRQDYLDDAKKLHQRLAKDDPQVEIVEIAGCHRRTLTDIWRAEEMDAAHSAKPAYTLVSQECGDDSGDGTVPLWSTRHANIPTYYIEEDHNLLPGNPAAIEAVLALVRGETPALPAELPEPANILQKLKPLSLLQQVADLRQHIESGEMTRVDLHKMLFAR